ncbi:MAG: tetratricopeptide repeat protein, partial [Thermoleophilaceae bacterium]
AETTAAAALLAGSPGAALAATTRAHHLEPKEASHLVNAASVATAVGLPREALALLDASVRLDDKVPSAWGLNRQALQLANRAHALAALGRFGEADTIAEAAEGLDPMLTEATATSSTAALCQDNIAKAVQKRKKARRRGTPYPFDESAGVAQPLRKLQLPGFPTQAEAFDQYYEAQQQRLQSDQMARINRESQLEGVLRGKTVDPLTERQGGRLTTAVYSAHEKPQLKAQWDEINRLVDEVQDYRIRFFCRDSDCEPDAHYYTQYFEESQQVCEGSTDPNCFENEINARCRPSLKSYHQGWLTRMETLWAKTDAYNRALSKRMSAIAGNIADPDRHALALLQIDALEEAHYALLMQQAGFWSQDIAIRSDHCVEVPEDPAVAAADAQAAAGDPCNETTKPFNAVLPLGPAAVKISCEQIQVTANGEGWIRGFAEISYDYRAGKITVFAGSQAEIGVGPIKGDFKSGLYVTVNNQGFEDAGWRVGPGYTVGAGPAEYNPSDMVDFSFVGIFSGGAR